jgi:hypothetical protein
MYQQDVTRLDRFPDYELRLTCGACPEQYDVYRNGAQVGYLRLRHGTFRADMPDASGETVFSAAPEGDGSFAEHERERFLTSAIAAIDAKLTGSGICPHCLR